MAIVGAFARIERERGPSLRTELTVHPGVSTFSLPDPGLVGLLLETDDLDSAHALLTGEIRSTPGVLGVWPVYANTEDEERDDEDRGMTRDGGIA